jgi:tetratricopeptide (TPR) repeat protein
MTYSELVAGGRLRGRATVAGIATDEPILRHRTALAAADAALRELELHPVRSSLTVATALIEDAESRNESAPRAHLEAGLALDALGDHAGAQPYLRTARNLSDEGSGSTGRRPTTDPQAQEWCRWACHHLGRILYEHGGDLNEAVAALRVAHERGPEEARTSFHLALAIQTLIQRESLREVDVHLRRYLDLGAPLGQTDRVREILRSIEG